MGNDRSGSSRKSQPLLGKKNRKPNQIPHKNMPIAGEAIDLTTPENKVGHNLNFIIK